jgi:hypothetical protein
MAAGSVPSFLARRSISASRSHRQRGVAVDGAVVEARQGGEAGAPARDVHDPAMVDPEAGFAERGAEFGRGHLRFLFEVKGRMVRPHAGNRVEAGGDLVHALVALPAD